MKTVTQYREDITALMKKAADIDTKCVAENRDPSAAELTLQNEIMDTVKEYQAIIATTERKERIAAELASPVGAVTRPGPQQVNGTTNQSSGRVEFPTDSRSRDRFGSLGENLAAIINAGQPGGRIDPRLLNVATGLNETVPSEGGFLIQQDFANRLSENLFENGLIAGQCERIPISGNSNGIVLNGFDETSRASSTSGGIIVYHTEEAGEKLATKPKFRRVELALKKIIGACYLTDELMMDAPAMESRVGSAFQRAFDFQVQDDLINGSGAGMALGVLNAGCRVVVSKKVGQTAVTVVAENIIDMYSRRFASQTQNYMWLYNQNIEPHLFTMSLAVGAGGIPLYMPPGGLSESPYGRILGLPAYAIEQCATLGTQGDIILANFKDGYVMAEKGGLKSDTSIHVRFMYDESVLRFVLRMDGQPWRATALTPYKGGATSTQSHFIVLETRA
jgi:HK97 family phage major capsid protein